MGARFERLYPLIGGIALSGLCYLVFRSSTIPPGTKDLMTSFLNVAAIIVGFLVTAQSILLSIDGKWIVERAKESGAYAMLTNYITAATYWWMAVALVSAFGLALTPAGELQSWQQPYAVACFAVWVFVAGTGSFAAFRVLSIFSTILKSISRG